MHFRGLPEGGCFPPIIPNGTFIASSMAGHPRQAVFDIRATGTTRGGVSLLWEEITGILLDDVRCKLTSDKYRSGGLEFQLGQCELRTEQERITRVRDTRSNTAC